MLAPGTQPRPVATPAAANQQLMQAGIGVTPTSTIRLTVPQMRQKQPVVSNSPQVLKVMGSQPGSMPQIITLSSARASGVLASVSYGTEWGIVIEVFSG